jgi:hypothetical protein
MTSLLEHSALQCYKVNRIQTGDCSILAGLVKWKLQQANDNFKKGTLSDGVENYSKIKLPQKFIQNIFLGYPWSV